MSRGACEICLEHSTVRPIREVRRVRTEAGWLYLQCCGPHSSALTIHLAREEEAAKAIPRTYFITEDERGEKLACEVH